MELLIRWNLELRKRMDENPQTGSLTQGRQASMRQRINNCLILQGLPDKRKNAE